MRPFYDNLIEDIESSTKTNVSLIGYPSVGKTGFLFYYFLNLVSRSKPVIFLPYGIRFGILVYRSNNQPKVRRFYTDDAIDLLKSIESRYPHEFEDMIVLFDSTVVEKVRTFCFRQMAVLASSPNIGKNFVGFEKKSLRKEIYFDFFNMREIIVTAKSFKKIQNNEILLRIYRIYQDYSKNMSEIFAPEVLNPDTNFDMYLKLLDRKICDGIVRDVAEYRMFEFYSKALLLKTSNIVAILRPLSNKGYSSKYRIEFTSKKIGTFYFEIVADKFSTTATAVLGHLESKQNLAPLWNTITSILGLLPSDRVKLFTLLV